MPETPNPATDVREAAILHLVDAGFSREEARNLIAALRATSAEELTDAAPKWIAWCARIRESYECIVDLAAKGMITVQWADDPDNMLLSLKADEPEGPR